MGPADVKRLTFELVDGAQEVLGAWTDLQDCGRLHGSEADALASLMLVTGRAVELGGRGRAGRDRRATGEVSVHATTGSDRSPTQVLVTVVFSGPEGLTDWPKRALKTAGR